jgi:multidrug efflux pump subunit AcrA (membrane-fusion protein)
MPANKRVIFMPLIFCINFFFLGCFKKEEIVPPPVEKVTDSSVKINSTAGLKIEIATQKLFPVSIEYNGKIAVPDKDILTLSSRVNGRLESLSISVGDRVTKGMVVGSMWSSDLATTAEEYAIALKEGGEILTLTKQKMQALGVSAAEMSPGKTTFYLRSPADGVVIEKKINVGGAANPGDAILTIGKTESIQFIGDVPPEIAIQVLPNMAVLFDDAPSLTASVESVSPISDQSTHLVRVRAKFKSTPPRDLPQDSFLKARIVLREVPSMVIPAKSLLLIQNQEYIFVQSDTDEKLYNRVAVHVSNRTSAEIAIAADAFTKDKIKVISEGALLVNEALNEESKD